MENFLARHRLFPIALLIGLLSGALFLAGAVRSPTLGLGLILGGICFLSILFYPAIGIGLLTFLIPLERMQRFTNDDAAVTVSVMRILGLMTLLAIVLHRIREKRSLRLDASMFLYAAYVGLSCVGVFFSSDPVGSERAMSTILANCLFLVLFVIYFENLSQIRLAIFIWLAATILGAAYSTYDWHFGSGAAGGIEEEMTPNMGMQVVENRWATVYQDHAEWETLEGLSVRRSMGPTSHPAVYGMNLIMTIPFFFYYLRHQRKLLHRTGLYACLALVGYNVLLTNTRAVMLVAALTVLMCIGFGLFRLKTGHVLAALLVLALAIPCLPQDLLNRVLDPRNYSTEKAAAFRIRLAYWDAGVHLLQNNFLLGFGVGNQLEIPRHLTGPLTADQTSVHLVYLQIALEAGLVGFVVFFGFVGVVYSYARKARRVFGASPDSTHQADIATAIEIGMISVLIFGLQADVFFFPLKGWWLMVTIAIALHRWASTRSIAGEAVAPVRLQLA